MWIKVKPSARSNISGFLAQYLKLENTLWKACLILFQALDTNGTAESKGKLLLVLFC